MDATTRLLARLLPLLAVSCGGSTDDPAPGSTTTAAGGTSASQGGSSTGPTGQGGASAGTSAQGGASAGTSSQGGATAGTSSQGGASAGTSAQGGAAGASSQGGASAGTSSQGGASAGTTSQGGASTGGSAQGGAAGSSAQGGSGVGGGQGGSPIACANTPLLPDADTGYLVCGPGSVHRVDKLSCPNHLPTMNNVCAGMMGGPPGECQADTDCTMAPHGYCGPNQGGGAFICGCHYGCVDDAGCGAGEICLCGTDIGTCVSTSCRSDAECGGGYCLSYSIPGGCSSTTAFACTAPADACVTDDDCGAGGGPSHPVCSHDGTKRVCLPGPGLCGGRPLFVEEMARVAALSRTNVAWV